MVEFTTAYDVIICPVVSEKTEKLKGKNVYVFKVNLHATKVDIKRAIEKIYSVKVDKVRTAIIKSKPKRYRFLPGRTKAEKKAYVSLRPGCKIEVY